ncbi:hypothetical protein AAVH_29334 [Aphelenchoides avenae]|nr:hypothetical protein AAVH_29334 [Aphelenchus avenae]
MDLHVTNRGRLIGALAELHSLVGPHTILKLYVDNVTFSVKLLVDRVPGLRHASVVGLNYASYSSPSLQEYTEIVSFFERPVKIAFREIPIEALAILLQAPAPRSSNTGQYSPRKWRRTYSAM